MTDFAMGSRQPAFTEPGPDRNQEITLEWEERGICKGTVSYDVARELLGLGGTPDVEMDWKVRLLMEHSPSLLSKLAPYVTDEQMYPIGLKKVNGLDPGDI